MNNENILNNLNEKKAELNELIKNKTNGILLRAKADWVEGAEKNTAYFSNLEKKKSENKTIKRIVKNNIEITNHTDVLKETQLFSGITTRT